MPLAVGGLTKTSFPLTNSVMNSREYQLAHFTIGLSRPRLHDPSSTVGPQPSRNTRDIIAHEFILGPPALFFTSCHSCSVLRRIAMAPRNYTCTRAATVATDWYNICGGSPCSNRELPWRHEITRAATRGGTTTSRETHEYV